MAPWTGQTGKPAVEAVVEEAKAALEEAKAAADGEAAPGEALRTNGPNPTSSRWSGNA